MNNNGIFRKVVRLKYIIEQTMAMPKKFKHKIIFNFHEGKGHQGITRMINLIRRYFWWIGLYLDVQHYISTCKLCAQSLPNKILIKPMHLDIPNIAFTGCVVDSIGILLTTTKGHKFAWTFVCLLTSYVTAVPLKPKTVEEVMMVYLKEILSKTSCNIYILQDNGTELKNNCLISTFESLGIKWIYSNPFYIKWTGWIENVHNFLKRTIAKLMHNSTLEWDDDLPLAVYCFNVVPQVNDLESTFYLVHGRDLLEGRLGHLKNYCRDVEQPGRLTVQELRNMWKTHAKLLWELRQSEPETEKKYNSTRDLKEGQLVLMKDHNVRTFQPKDVTDYRVIKIINENTVIVRSPGGREIKCNIHHIKPISPTKTFTSTFEEFTKCIKEGNIYLLNPVFSAEVNTLQSPFK